MRRKFCQNTTRRCATDAELYGITQAICRLFTIPENAKLIGISYLQFNPDRADKELLLKDLGEEITALALGNDPGLRSHISDQQHHDFLHGNTVIVNNWILSRTEASLCALAALS